MIRNLLAIPPSTEDNSGLLLQKKFKMKVILKSIGSQYKFRAMIFLPLSSAILFSKAV